MDFFLAPYNRPVDAGSAFEREFAAWLGVPHAVATGFGRSALKLALSAAGVSGHDVLVPEFICAQVPEAVRCVGGRPVFYPVERDLSVSLGRFHAAITPETGAAIVPHYFGRVLAGVEAVAAICRERHIVLIEDCALALGASLGGKLAGTFGDLAVFSFTKSDWCYGGGVAAAGSAALADAMRRVRDAEFTASAGLARWYGWLRRADFLANRPRWSGLAERAGRTLERLIGQPSGNFYDSGRFDATMSDLCARRAGRILRELEATTARKRARVAALTSALKEVAHILVRPEPDPGDAASFVVLRSLAGRAADWAEEAARGSVTLRRSWPAYQPPEPGQPGGEQAWFADHIMLLEIHQDTTSHELEHIEALLKSLAARG